MEGTQTHTMSADNADSRRTADHADNRRTSTRDLEVREDIKLYPYLFDRQADIISLGVVKIEHKAHKQILAFQNESRPCGTATRRR